MFITINDVEHVAKLAHLEFSQEEKEKLVVELNSILQYMDKLNEIDTSSIAPLSHVNELINVMRNDSIVPSFPRSEALKNAPDHDEEFFKVPKVIG